MVRVSVAQSEEGRSSSSSSEEALCMEADRRRLPSVSPKDNFTRT